MKLSITIIILLFAFALYLTHKVITEANEKKEVVEHHNCPIEGYGYVETSKIGTMKEAKVYDCPGGFVFD